MGHPKFAKFLCEMQTLHDEKSSEYGTEEDPFANYRASERCGVPAWFACFLRLVDKMARAEVLCSESFEKQFVSLRQFNETFIDIAIQAVNILILIEGDSNDDA